MRKTLPFVLSLFWVTHLALAGEQSVPINRILPEDVVQESVHQWRMGTNNYAVDWVYTEEGAKKMLAFREAHEGRKARMAIGSFESPPGQIMFRPMPPTFTNYAQWKEGWLKHRTDKVIGVSEQDAHRILAGLKTR